MISMHLQVFELWGGFYRCPEHVLAVKNTRCSSVERNQNARSRED